MFEIALVAAAVALLGCSERVPNAGADGDRTATDPGGSDPAIGETTRLMSFDEGVSWAAGPGFEVGPVHLVGDANGDGIGDAAVRVTAIGDTQSVDVYLVAGPFGADLVLPGDEFAIVPNFLLGGDFDGDGVADAKVFLQDPVTLVPTTGAVYGPLSGRIDLATADLSVVIGDVDIDADGALDKFVDVEGVLDIWWGPISPDANEPDSSITFDCSALPAEDRAQYWNPHWLSFGADITGDGIDDGYGGGFFWVSDCTGYVFPVLRAGTLHTSTDPRVVTGVESFVTLSDQNGDGAADVLLEGRNLVAGPVTFVDGQVTGVAIASAAEDVTRLVPARVDLDTDGTSDFLAWFGASYFDGSDDETTEPAIPGFPTETTWYAVVVFGGADGVSASSWETAWEVGDDASDTQVYVDEDGRGWMITAGDAERVVLYDVGADPVQ